MTLFAPSRMNLKPVNGGEGLEVLVFGNSILEAKEKGTST